MPDAADIRALLEDREVVKSLMLQRYCCRDAGYARTDDDDPRLPRHYFTSRA
jgi:hypothetical protein